MLTEDSSQAPLLRRARVVRRNETGCLVLLFGETTPQEVSRAQIRRRVSLPWKPSDLRDYLIVFRRHNASKDGCVQDSRTRRVFV